MVGISRTMLVEQAIPPALTGNHGFRREFCPMRNRKVVIPFRNNDVELCYKTARRIADPSEGIGAWLPVCFALNCAEENAVYCFVMRRSFAADGSWFLALASLWRMRSIYAPHSWQRPAAKAAVKAARCLRVHRSEPGFPRGLLLPAWDGKRRAFHEKARWCQALKQPTPSVGKSFRRSIPLSFRR